MNKFTRAFATLSLAAGLGLGLNASAWAEDTMSVVVGSGPHAGTYDLSGADGNFIGCGTFPGSSQLSAVYKDMKAVMNGAKPDQLKSVGFNIFNPDDSGPKTGGIIVIFGDGSSQTTYEIMVPKDSAGPLDMKRNGPALALHFDGKGKDGVGVKIDVKCTM